MIIKLDDVDTKIIVSDILKEYIRFKNKYLDSLVLLQVGSFYEAYFDDAKLLSDNTGVTLTSRKYKDVGEVALAGIPFNNLSANIKKLLNSNIKVCVCNQFKEGNKYKRKAVRLYTRGTIVESEFLDSTENNYIAALYHNDGIIYFAYADVSTGQFYKTYGDINLINQEIDKISPSEILISARQREKFKTVTEKYNTTILKSNFFEAKNIENTIIKYCSLVQKDFISKLDNVIEYNITSNMIIDEISRQNLEIIKTKRFLKKKGSLFWFLNYTKTPMGARLLKKCINEPLLNVDIITQRQIAVKELIENKALINDIIVCLQGFFDLSRICALILNSTILPKDLLLIAKNSDILGKLNQICQKFKSDLLRFDKYKIIEACSLSDKIKSAICESPSNELKSGGIIKEGFNTRLDYYNGLLQEKYAELKQYELKEQKKFDTDKLQIRYTGILGYFIEVPLSKKSFIPENYTKKQTLSSCIRLTNDKLSILESEILNLKYKINDFEYELYMKLRQEAVEFVNSIRILSSEIARLDMLVSFAMCAIENNLVCPSFNSENKLIIKNGFHPSLIRLNNNITKNDTEIKSGQMIILTGANMSGKSTYIKYNALICLMAQIGSFVPAGYASCPIIDKIFVRQSVSDDIINNNSSFMVEMDDLKFILENATPSSLVLLDEPAKSTNSQEGGAIARAYLEYLLKYKGPFVFVVTHNFEITKSEEKLPNKIFNYKMGNIDSANATLDRKIKRGIARQSFAINTAQLADLPVEIIRNAKIYFINSHK